jgi:hypothetical protein
MVKIQVSQGKAETTVNTNNVWDRIVALENGVTVPTNAALNLKADKTALDVTNANVTANAALLVDKAKQVTQVFNVKGYGAKGDGVTDDSQAIQSVLNLCKTNGGGIVYFPDGKYMVSQSFNVPDNTTIKGNGATSWIHNTTVSGMSRIIFMLNNVGDIAASDGTSPLLNETYYNVSSMVANQVTLSSTDAAHFSVGDLVFIVSTEVFPTNSNCRKYEIIDKVIGKSGNTITLKYGYEVAITAPKIAKIGATANGWDGQKMWLTQNSKVTDLKLSHGLGQSSGMYVVFSGGFECEFSRLTIVGSTLMGSNAAGYCLYEDIDGQFDAGLMDNSTFQCNNVFKRVRANRVGTNSQVNLLGFTLNNGKDNCVENCEFDFGGTGGVSSTFALNPTFKDNIIKNAVPTNSNCCLTGCSYGKSIFINNKIINVNASYGGISANDGSILIDNKIFGFTPTSGQYPYFVNGNIYNQNNTVDVYTNNLFSTYTPIKSFNYNAIPNNMYKSNTTFCQSTTPTTIASGTVFKKTTKTVNRHMKIIIHGTFRTKLNTGNLQVQIGGTAIFNQTQAINASDIGFLLEMDLIIPGQASMRYINKFTTSSPVITSGSLAMDASAGDINFTILGSILDATAADFVSVDGYSIEYFE